jgi:nickel superoxide dismutase
MTPFSAANAVAHCEVLCGIYDDSLRMQMIAEHLTTIEKSMRKIVELNKHPSV